MPFHSFFRLPSSPEAHKKRGPWEIGALARAGRKEIGVSIMSFHISKQAVMRMREIDGGEEIGENGNKWRTVEKSSKGERYSTRRGESCCLITAEDFTAFCNRAGQWLYYCLSNPLLVFLYFGDNPLVTLPGLKCHFPNEGLTEFRNDNWKYHLSLYM